MGQHRSLLLFSWPLAYTLIVLYLFYVPLRDSTVLLCLCVLCVVSCVERHTLATTHHIGQVWMAGGISHSVMRCWWAMHSYSLIPWSQSKYNQFCLCLITWKLRLYNEMHLYLVHHQVETFHTGELIFSQPPSKDYQFIKNVLAWHGGICLQYQHSGWDRRFVNLRLTSAMEVRPDLVGDYYTLTVQCSCCAFELHCSF